MSDSKGNLYLYEALELRAEFDARIKTQKGLLPENRGERNRFSMQEEEVKYYPVDSFDVTGCRDAIKKLELKKRRLNTAIQKTNFLHEIEIQNETMTIAEALDLRKATSAEIAEIQAILKESAYKKVIYKEERDIEELSDIAFYETNQQLDKQRLLFRILNRSLRKASFEIAIDFKDEKA